MLGIALLTCIFLSP